jgi:hypothetical protein
MVKDWSVAKTIAMRLGGGDGEMVDCDGRLERYAYMCLKSCSVEESSGWRDGKS